MVIKFLIGLAVVLLVPCICGSLSYLYEKHEVVVGNIIMLLIIIGSISLVVLGCYTIGDGLMRLLF